MTATVSMSIADVLKRAKEPEVALAASGDAAMISIINDQGRDEIVIDRETLERVNHVVRRLCLDLLAVVDALESTERVFSDCQQDLHNSDGYKMGRKETVNELKVMYARVASPLLTCSPIHMDREAYYAFRKLGDQIEALS